MHKCKGMKNTKDWEGITKTKILNILMGLARKNNMNNNCSIADIYGNHRKINFR